MEYRKIKIFLVLFITALCGSSAFAQTSDEKSIPLHVEVSLETGTENKGIMPSSAVVDLGYNIRRFSIHAAAQADMFQPKEGSTHDYNRSRNIGGGIGYVIFPEDKTNLGVFEVRALVTTSVGSSDFNNTSYKLGIHWYGYSSTRKVLPMVSVGYTIKDFREKSLPSNRGMYLALGFRF